MHKFLLYQHMLCGLKLSDNVFKCNIPAQLTIVILHNYLVTVTPKLQNTSTHCEPLFSRGGRCEPMMDWIVT